jgi:transcription elongation GreA/GreB family factor
MADTEALIEKLDECARKHDFEEAFKIVRGNQAGFMKNLQPAGVLELLKKTTSDRLLLSFLDGVGFGTRPLGDSMVALEKLLSFRQGGLVLSKAWGLGTVKRLDYFYKRITVDFNTKKGHQFTYAAAVDMLDGAPEDHVLVLRQSDPARFEAMLKERPAEFVKAVLKSYGDMSAAKLEDVCVANGFVKAVNWKAFWDGVRAELKKDGLVEIPVKRSDPIRLKASAEDYGEGWLTAFSHETDPKLILASVREYVAQNKFKTAEDDVKAKIGERLRFAVTAARKVDDALYARLACTVSELGFSEPAAAEMREYLWERKRFVTAAAELPAREVGAMIGFLACDDEARTRLYRAIPDLCFTAVSEIVARFGAEEGCRSAVGAFMNDPKAPATLTTLIAGKYESFMDWKELPPLTTVLTHAIALGEGRQSGETLKMQNLVRRLFSGVDWLKKVFGWLNESEQALFFERFQASIAWDHSMHHTIVVRMTKIAPGLESRVVKAEKKREYARITSYRSFALRKREYLKLINEDMPANVKRIEFAKSYGDLSENAEYQYAKDEQRALMQKQSLMQADLEAVKPGDFADASTDEVMPGVTVVLAGKEGEKTYTILGEWDNDLEIGVISSKTRVAGELMGKKAGDAVALPTADGGVENVTVKEIKPLSDDIRRWMALPEGEVI